MIEYNKGVEPARPSLQTVARYSIPISLVLTLCIGMICGVVWTCNMNKARSSTDIPVRIGALSSTSLSLDDMICRDKQSLDSTQYTDFKDADF